MVFLNSGLSKDKDAKYSELDRADVKISEFGNGFKD